MMLLKQLLTRRHRIFNTCCRTFTTTIHELPLFASICERINNRAIPLRDRGLISFTGADTVKFLQNYLTNDLYLRDDSNWEEPDERLPTKTRPFYSGMLGVNGRMLYDAFVYPLPDAMGYLMDCEASQTAAIMAHFNRYKLRSKVSECCVGDGGCDCVL